MEQPAVILLDFWGVIGVVQTDDDLAEMASVIGADLGAFKRAYWHHREFFDAGGERARYWEMVGADLGVEVGSHLDELGALDVGSWSRVDPAMLDLIAELGADGRRLALLSNAPPDLVGHATAVLADLVPELLFSSDLGLAKPDPRIFAEAVARLGVQPDEVLFIDDNPVNVTAAREFGMQALLHESVPQTRAEILGG